MNQRILLSTLLALGFTLSAATAGKVLYIDSYHEGYPWSDGITKGIQTELDGAATLKIHRMDTKRHATETDKIKAAAAAKALIESWKPDVVIASDDNAAKYLIAPNYKEAALPFVFCGVNWDASLYGFPTANICGMEEVGLIKPLMAQMTKFSKGDTVGFLSGDNLTAHNEADNYGSKFGLKLEKKFVNTAAEWKAAFTELQGSVSMLILENNAGITGWDETELKAFVQDTIQIPTGTVQDWMMPYCLFGYTKLPEEQGEWAAQAAKTILAGKSPGAIGVTQNKKGKLYVNLTIANTLGVKVPIKTLKSATIVK